MTLFEMYGRYAEDPMVVVEAATAEEAAAHAIRYGMRVSRGYHEGGALIPTPLPEDAARRYRERAARRYREGRDA